MSPAYKQRVIGGAVLVALGLIIVPVVLDFSRDERTDVRGVEIPLGPDALQMEVLPLDQWSEKMDTGVERSDVVVDAVEPTESATPVSVEAAVAAAPKSEPTIVEQAPAVKAAPLPPVAVKPEPATVAPPKVAVLGKGEGWVVQVASLSAESSANELRDQLRKSGAPAFVERGRSGSGTIYRIKVGPVATRAEADQLKRQIKQSNKLDGLVIKNQ